MLNEKEITDKQAPEQEKSMISRRKLLASLGIVGIALGSSGLINKALAAPNVDQVDSRTKVKDLMGMNLVVTKTIADLRANPQLNADNIYFIRDYEQEGPFRYDPSDTTSLDNTGTILVSTSGARFKRIYNGAVNVKWFGAKGDGVTAADQAFQTAIDAADLVYIPNGNYLFANSVELTNNKNIFGESRDGTKIIKRSTTLNSYGFDSAFTVEISPNFVAPVSMKDFTISGDYNANKFQRGNGSIGFHLNNSYHFYFENVKIEHFEYGIKGKTVWGGECRSLWISNCFYGFYANPLESGNSGSSCTSLNFDGIKIDDCMIAFKVVNLVYSQLTGYIQGTSTHASKCPADHIPIALELPNATSVSLKFGMEWHNGVALRCSGIIEAEILEMRQSNEYFFRDTNRTNIPFAEQAIFSIYGPSSAVTIKNVPLDYTTMIYPDRKEFGDAIFYLTSGAKLKLDGGYFGLNVPAYLIVNPSTSIENIVSVGQKAVGLLARNQLNGGQEVAVPQKMYSGVALTNGGSIRINLEGGYTYTKIQYVDAKLDTGGTGRTVGVTDISAHGFNLTPYEVGGAVMGVGWIIRWIVFVSL